MGKLVEKTTQVWTIEGHEWGNLRCKVRATISDTLKNTGGGPDRVARTISEAVLEELPRLLEGMGIQINVAVNYDFEK